MAKRVTIRITDELEEYAIKSHIPLATAMRELAIKGLYAATENVPSNGSNENILEAIRLLAKDSSCEERISELLGTEITFPKEEIHRPKPKKQPKPKKVEESRVEPEAPKRKITESPKEDTLEVNKAVPPAAPTPVVPIAEPPKPQPQPAAPVFSEFPDEDTSNNLTISEDTDEPISDDLMASLNDMLGIL